MVKETSTPPEEAKEEADASGSRDTAKGNSSAAVEPQAAKQPATVPPAAPAPAAEEVDWREVLTVI